MAADAFQQFALPAFLAFSPSRNTGFVGKHFFIGFVQVDDEFSPELLYGLPPRQLTLFDFVELILHPRRKFEVENVLEAFYQQLAYALTKHGRRKPTLILGDVFPLDERRDNRSVSGRAANPVLFELFDQRRIVISRGRFGEVLLRANLIQPQQLTLCNLGQRSALALVVLFILLAVRGSRRQLVNAEISVKFLYRSARAERVFAGANINGRLVKDRRQHLRRHKSLPDQLVQLEQVVVQIPPYLFRRARDVGRTHGFVRLLRVFLRLVEIRLLGKIVGTILRGDEFANLRQRIARNMHRVRAHVSNQRHRAFRTQLHTFIEL